MKPNKCIYCGSDVKGKRRHFCSDVCNQKYWGGVYSKKWKVGTSLMNGDKPTTEEIENSKKKYQARKLAYKNYKLGDVVKCDLCYIPTKNIQRHHEDYSKPEVFMLVCTKCHGFIKRYKSLSKMLFQLNVPRGQTHGGWKNKN